MDDDMLLEEEMMMDPELQEALENAEDIAADESQDIGFMEATLFDF